VARILPQPPMFCCSRRDLLSDHVERPNNSLKPTRLAGGNASVPCPPSWPRMKAPSLSRRAA